MPTTAKPSGLAEAQPIMFAAGMVQPYADIWREAYESRPFLTKHAGRATRSRDAFYHRGAGKALALDKVEQTGRRGTLGLAFGWMIFLPKRSRGHDDCASEDLTGDVARKWHSRLQSRQAESDYLRQMVALRG